MYPLLYIKSGLIFSIFGLLALEMAIKAKIKATALEPFIIDFWSFFLSSNRVLGRTYHLKKFHQLLWTSTILKTAIVLFGETNVSTFFRHFFMFQPLFPMENDQKFAIFFLIMVGVEVIHN